MYMGRPKTLDVTKMPNNVTMVANDREMRVKIAELNKNNPQATFTFYMNDLRIAKAFSYFYSQGIHEDRVKVVMLSDGTGTYVNFNQAYGESSSSYGFWLGNMERYTRELKYKLNLDANYFGKGVFLVAPDVSENTEFWMQLPELLVSASSDLKNYLQENKKRYYKVDPLAYFKSLPTSKQQEFISLVGLDKKWALGEGGGTLQNQTIGEVLDVSSKPNIIITGTSPYSNSERDMDALIAEAKSFYGSGYDYFFKGHPGDMTKPTDSSIVVLPFQLPMETIAWVYGDKINVIGGIESTLYMSVPKETKKFFFNEKSDGSTLASPLDLMYKQGLLGDVKFF